LSNGGFYILRWLCFSQALQPLNQLSRSWESSYGNQRDKDERNYPQNALIKKVATLSRTQGKKFDIKAE